MCCKLPRLPDSRCLRTCLTSVCSCLSSFTNRATSPGRVASPRRDTNSAVFLQGTSWVDLEQDVLPQGIKGLTPSKLPEHIPPQCGYLCLLASQVGQFLTGKTIHRLPLINNFVADEQFSPDLVVDVSYAAGVGISDLHQSCNLGCRSTPIIQSFDLLVRLGPSNLGCPLPPMIL